MGSDSVIGILLFVLAAVLTWLIVSPGRRADRREAEGEELEAAEQEVRDLGAFKSPDDADDELPDWGPGVPKRRS